MVEPDAATTGQVNAGAAEVYAEFFVPALFEQWPPTVLHVAGLRAGDDVVDIGCGTGVLAAEAARRLDGDGSVTGLDINADMLAVAARRPEPVTWRAGAAEDLPFPGHRFDRVVSQFALMFFRDRPAGVREMARVVRPEGSVTVATWCAIGQSPGYAALEQLLRRLFGDPAAAALAAPFCLGTPAELQALFDPVFEDVVVTRHDGVARFPSLAAWLHTDVRGWTLADLIDDGQFHDLLAAAEGELAPFAAADGHVSFAAPALVAVGRNPRRPA